MTVKTSKSSFVIGILSTALEAVGELFPEITHANDIDLMIDDRRCHHYGIARSHRDNPSKNRMHIDHPPYSTYVQSFNFRFIVLPHI